MAVSIDPRDPNILTKQQVKALPPSNVSFRIIDVVQLSPLNEHHNDGSVTLNGDSYVTYRRVRLQMFQLMQDVFISILILVIFLPAHFCSCVLQSVYFTPVSSHRSSTGDLQYIRVHSILPQHSLLTPPSLLSRGYKQRRGTGSQISYPCIRVQEVDQML